MKKIIKRRKRDSFLRLLSSPWLIIFFISLFCFFLAGFYFLSLEKNFVYNVKIPDVDMDSFNNVLDKWDKNRMTRENIREEYDFVFLDGFGELSQDNIGQETQKEAQESEEYFEIVDEIDVDIEVEVESSSRLTEEDVDRLLTETLYEYYLQRGEDIPDIPERAVLWEDLGLGDKDDYHGYYHQNIIFLRKLMGKNSL